MNTRFKSIRIKFFAWYGLILLATFLLFSLALYYNFRHSLYENFDDVLESKAEGVVASIDTYWETEKLEAVGEGAKEEEFRKTNNANFLKIAQRWVEEKSNDPELWNIIVRVYDQNGHIITHSDNFPEVVTLTQEGFLKTVLGKNYFENRAITVALSKTLTLRMFTVPVIENGGIAYIVQVMSPLVSIDLALYKLKIMLFLLLPLVVILTSILAGEFLASVTLRPLNNMIKIVRQITAEDLTKKIEMADTKDEIKKLADTFNEMLDKINISFVSQRQFIQDISHELRTPLTVLKGELEVALKKIRSKEEYVSVLHSNLEEIDKMNRLIENLLMLARFDNESAALHYDSCNISQMWASAIGDLELLREQKNITINFHDLNDFVIMADHEKLQRVFLNLLDNAIKYTPDAGVINISIAVDGTMAVIRVKNTGIGISKDDLAFIFDRFYRAEKSRTSRGFGLGLSIAKSIIHAHGGSISVHSDPGKTTEFILSLPQHPAK